MTALEYFEGNELAASVWAEKYALRDKDDNLLESNPDEMHRRIAKEFARIEKKKFKKPYSEDFIYSLLKDFNTIIPQGSPMSGIGSNKYVSLSNCFVVHPPVDSYAGICYTDEQLVQICKRRGGVGTDISAIRPDSAATTNSSRFATGILPFMERFSNSIREVGQNGRRGALMLTISVHHPQVLDFARVKLDPSRVTGANVSIRLSNEFLEAVKKNKEYEQRWPVNSDKPEISKWVNAREIWMEIIKCAHARAEPGLLFWDQIIEESPADCYIDEGFDTIGTNPCAELPLCLLDSCRLLLNNLFSCVVNPFADNAYFDFIRLHETTYIAQRLMDDLVDLEIEAIDRIISKIKKDPEPEYIKSRELDMWKTIRLKATQGRRTGTGPTALGDVVAALGIKYGSNKCIKFVEKVYKTMKLAAYRASVDMAEELGAFPIWDKEKEKNNSFLLRIKGEDAKLYKDMQKYGRRNIALLTTAPAGSASILAGPRPYFGTTSGIEPLFSDQPHTRRKKINHAEKNSRIDFVDEQGDKWTEYPVYHSKIQMWMDITGNTDPSKSPYNGSCAEQLNWKQRVKLQAAANRHVDHSISSTLNLPEDVTVEKVAEIYETAWEEGCKGITVYRKNCRSGVLVDKKQKGPTPTKQQDTFIKRPKELECDYYSVTSKGLPIAVMVGLYEGSPYEVFAMEEDSQFTEEMKSGLKGTIRKLARGDYKLLLLDKKINITESLTDEQAAIARLTSTSLRHGVEIQFIVHQLEKVKGHMNSFSKAIARVLKKYIKDDTPVTGETCEECNNTTLVRQEGCVTCKGCGWSKCS